MYGDWEKDIIIDPEVGRFVDLLRFHNEQHLQNMERVREPPELILDENDDHLIFEIPNDPNDTQPRQQRSIENREKTEQASSVSPTKGGKVPHKVRFLLKINDFI